MSKKQYRLLKDLPDGSNKGDYYGYMEGSDKVYINKSNPFKEKLSYKSVENNAEWFELVSEPEKEMVGVTVTEMNTYNSRVHYGYSFNVHSVDIDCGKIKQAIESALNDTVVEDKGFVGEELVGLLRDCVSSTWGNPSLDKTQVLFDKFLHDRKLAPPSKGLLNSFITDAVNRNIYDKKYSESEVDAIRADTWYAARKITDKVVGEIDFKDGDRCPFYEKYFNSINDYLSSLNLNSNDTGKEDNETKSANWRSENLSKQSAPEPSALPTKEYEIISYIFNDVCYSKKGVGFVSPTGDYLLKGNKKDSEIHSVRRLKDMEVFCVGEVVDNFKQHDEIVRLAVFGDNMICDFKKTSPCNISYIKKLPPTPTEPVVEDKPNISEIPLMTTDDYKNNPLSSFYEPKNNTVTDNSDVSILSVNDVVKLFPLSGNEAIKRLNELVKQKLNK